jgi:hypothetical protein
MKGVCESTLACSGGAVAVLRSGGLAARHDDVCDQNLNGLAILVQGGHAHLDKPLAGPRLRRPEFEYFTLDAQLVPRPYRARPAELVEAGTDEAARRL